MREYSPTQNGKFTGYKAEFREQKGDLVSEWRKIPFTNECSQGVPYPDAFGGILKTICLSGYHQGLALGHWFAATAEAHRNVIIEIRVVPYEIKYDIKAKRLETAPK